ncbi:unnamed protein product [Peniophora sp. CBMAI 1063]|nr:unnamed protein product [Peniophora sp. CBMAI 1063]
MLLDSVAPPLPPHAADFGSIDVNHPLEPEESEVHLDIDQPKINIEDGDLVTERDADALLGWVLVDQARAWKVGQAARGRADAKFEEEENEEDKDEDGWEWMGSWETDNSDDTDDGQ